MISKKQKKFLIIGFTICALLGSGYTASAVYPVHDSRVYAQIVAQIKKVTEQINTIKQQIALQKQHLYDLGWVKSARLLKIFSSIGTNTQNFVEVFPEFCPAQKTYINLSKRRSMILMILMLNLKVILL